MNLRRALPTLLALLMPVPLVWLLSIAMFGLGPHARLTPPQGKTFVPMLSHEERLLLTTYAHDCRTDTDCDPQLRCAYDVPTSRHHCTDSLCTEDEHCPDGFTCIASSTENGKDLIRVCVLRGIRQEGELCYRIPESPKQGCAKGLSCQGFCGRPCRVDEPVSCPDGYYCRAGEEDTSCMPTCEGRPCPAGQRCIDLAGGQGSVCMTIHGQDCEQTSCPQGLNCIRTAYPSAPGHLWMECLRNCFKNQSPCPEGTACFLFQCRQSCDPENSTTCGPDFHCGRKHPSQPWVCLPGSASGKED